MDDSVGVFSVARRTGRDAADLQKKTRALVKKGLCFKGSAKMVSRGNGTVCPAIQLKSIPSTVKRQHHDQNT